MRCVRQIVVVLLVAMWLPTSSHALLEQAGLIHQLHEHDQEGDLHTGADHDADAESQHEHGAGNHAAADGLCLLATAKVQAPAPIVVAASGCLMVALVTLPVEANDDAPHSGLSPPGLAPPEFQHRWQFYFRAALPARAPSLIS